MTDEGEHWYVKKTKETSEADRGESVFFAELQAAAAPAAAAAIETAETVDLVDDESPTGGDDDEERGGSVSTRRAPTLSSAAAPPGSAFGLKELREMQLSLGVLKIRTLRGGFAKLMSEGLAALSSEGMVRLHKGLASSFTNHPGAALGSAEFFGQFHRYLAGDDDVSGMPTATLRDIIAALSVFAGDSSLIDRFRFAFSLFCLDEAQHGAI